MTAFTEPPASNVSQTPTLMQETVPYFKFFACVVNFLMLSTTESCTISLPLSNPITEPLLHSHTSSHNHRLYMLQLSRSFTQQCFARLAFVSSPRFSPHPFRCLDILVRQKISTENHTSMILCTNCHQRNRGCTRMCVGNPSLESSMRRTSDISICGSLRRVRIPSRTRLR